MLQQTPDWVVDGNYCVKPGVFAEYTVFTSQKQLYVEPLLLLLVDCFPV